MASRSPVHSANIWNLQRQRKLSPESHLWVAVLAMAVKDSRNAQSEGHAEAIWWLTTETNKDRELVWEFAGLHEGILVTWAREQYWEAL